jgi:hypothetical protein
MVDPIDIEELIGCAFQSGSLRMNPNGERALDRIAAFALASRRAAHRKPDRKPSDVDLVDAALGVALWHALHIDPVASHAAERLLALSLLLRPYGSLAVVKQESHRLDALATRCVSEWLHIRCGACGGTGLQEMVGVRRVRPRALMRNARLIPCAACGGNGAARVDAIARRHAIEVKGERMDRQEFAARWEPVFRMALGLCDRATGNLRGPTWRALRGRLHPSQIRA